MSDYYKFQRIIKLIGLLKQRPYTIVELADRVNTHKNNIYRYKDTLESSGFKIQKKGHRYFIEKPDDAIFSVEDFVSFSPSEASVIRNTLLGVPYSNPFIGVILSKLYSLADKHETVDIIYNQATCNNIIFLKHAVKNKFQVKLINYQSSSSGTIKDRILEPFQYFEDGQAVRAYEPSSKKIKHFKAARAGNVEVIQVPFKYSDKHIKSETDIFGMDGNPQMHIQLKLTLTAANLLKEEYPKSEYYFEVGETVGDDHIISIKIKGFEGIGRFILGLPGEIEVIGAPELQEYLMLKRSRDKYLGKNLKKNLVSR